MKRRIDKKERQITEINKRVRWCRGGLYKQAGSPMYNTSMLHNIIS
jgi:hypothetical protein